VAKKTKDFSVVVWVFGWLLGVAVALRKLANEASVPFEAFERLGSERGESTLKKIVQIVRGDWEKEQSHGGAIPLVSFSSFDHYSVVTGPSVPLPGWETLSRNFPNGNISFAFRDRQPWVRHSSCLHIDEIPREQDFVVGFFSRPVYSTQAISAGVCQGYRPALHNEVYRLVQRHPELIKSVWLVAIGSWIFVDGRRQVAVIGKNEGEVFFGVDDFESFWEKGRYGFVLVRDERLWVDSGEELHVPEGWSIRPEDQIVGAVRELFAVSEATILLIRPTATVGEDLCTEFAGFGCANVCVHDYFLVNPERYPESWKGSIVLFLGTIFHSQANGLSYIEYLSWDEKTGQCVSGSVCLEERSFSNKIYRVAVVRL